MHPIAFRSALALFAGLAASAPFLAQSVAPGRLDAAAELRRHEEALARATAPAEPSSIPSRSHGLGWSQGELWGCGPDYKARFTDAGVEFVLALGAAVETNHGLAFSLESIRRGEALIYADTARSPEPARDVVRYALAPGIAELYEVRRDGVEQSYVFESLPAGAGDLVVSGRVRSGFPQVSSDGAGGLVFGLSGIGSVRYGGVTGVDAAGSRVAGELRLSGERLDLVLPAAFVDAAVFPLVLDPLIGGDVSIAVDPVFDDADADLAYDLTTNDYLFVWERQFSGSDVDIRGQRFGGGGAPSGGLIGIETTIADVALNPTVANCNVNDRFLVAWQQGPSALGPWHIEVAAVDASDGLVSTSVALTTDGAPDLDPDAGGESDAAEDRVVVAYQEQGTGIKARYVTVPMTGAPVPADVLTISNNANDSKPAISKSGGTPGRYLVVWKRHFSVPAPGDHDLVSALIDRNAGILVSAASIASTIGPDEEDPDVDGDGTDFLVVYEREASSGSGDNDILGRPAAYTGGGSLTLGAAAVLEGDPGDDEINPAVGFASYKYLVAWADESSGLDYDVTAMGVGTAVCVACEGELGVDTGSSGVDQIEIASRFSGGAAFPADRAWLAWGQLATTPGFAGDIAGQSWQAVGAGGAIVDLGGACGGGGTNGTDGAVALGDAAFTCTLAGADPTAPLAFLNIAGAPVPISCGACAWNPFAMLFTRPLLGGSASVVVPIPCDLGLLGAVVQSQWTVVLSAASPCALFPNVSLSQRLALSVGL